MTIFTNKDFYEWFQLCLLFNPFQNGLYIFWTTFCKNSIRISCQIFFVNKHWLQSCPSPFKYHLLLTGRYPLHYHMCYDLANVTLYPTRSYIRHNSIHHTNFRCVTVHGTHSAHVCTNIWCVNEIGQYTNFRCVTIYGTHSAHVCTKIWCAKEVRRYTNVRFVTIQRSHSAHVCTYILCVKEIGR